MDRLLHKLTRRLFMHQTTIQCTISCSGTGLHGGKEVSCIFRPAPADTGIIFALHTEHGVRRVSPAPHAVMGTALATTLGDRYASVSTIEHLMASLRGLGIDNCLIEVNGGEVPILDGSAAVFLDLFARAGVRELDAPRRVLRLKRPVELRDGEKYIRAVPAAGFRVNYTIDFPHPVIRRQHLTLEVTPQSFCRVACARTFGFLREVEYLHKNGLALGGSLDNAVVLDEKKVLNPEGLRCPDEFVRHKILDFIGDMAMLSLPLEGSFTVACSGHGLNNEFLRKLVDENALEVVELPLRGRRLTIPAYEGSLALA